MVKVLDACALMAYLEKETGYEKVKELFVKAVESEKNVMMTTVNWGEVFYILVREYGIGEAEKIQRVIETFPIDFVTVDVPLAKQAALYKATKKLPYADCFAAALAKLHKGEVVAGDKEFIELESDIKITLIL